MQKVFLILHTALSRGGSALAMVVANVIDAFDELVACKKGIWTHPRTAVKSEYKFGLIRTTNLAISYLHLKLWIPLPLFFF
jgi:hypothetical protein